MQLDWSDLGWGDGPRLWLAKLLVVVHCFLDFHQYLDPFFLARDKMGQAINHDTIRKS
jgi:hypothetical protein